MKLHSKVIYEVYNIFLESKFFKMAAVAMETEKGGKIQCASKWMKLYRKVVYEA